MTLMKYLSFLFSLCIINEFLKFDESNVLVRNINIVQSVFDYVVFRVI